MKFLKVTCSYERESIRLIALDQIVMIEPLPEDQRTEPHRTAMRLKDGNTYLAIETVEEIEAQIADLQRVRLGDLPRVR